MYDKCGASRFTYHYYPDTGGSVLGENELTWGSDGWPVAGAPSTTPLTACADQGAGGASGAGTGGASAGTGRGGTSGDAGGTGGGADDAGLPPQTGGASGLGTGGGRAGGTGGASNDPGAGTGGSSGGFGGSSPGSGGATGGSGAATGATGGPAATGDSSGCSCAVAAGSVVHDAAVAVFLIGLPFFLGAQLRPRRKRHS